MCSNGGKVCLVLFVIGTFILFLTQHFLAIFTNCIAIKAYSYHILADAMALFAGLMSLMKQNSVQSDHCATTKNTFGWVRIKLLGELSSYIAIVSLCFSCSIDSLQLLVNPDVSLHSHCKTMLALGGLGVLIHLSVALYSLILRCCISNSAGITKSANKHSQPNSALEKQSQNNTEIFYESKQENEVEFRRGLFNIGIGLIAATLIVIDALCHFLIDHHHHYWIHYVDPCLAIVIIGIIMINVIPLLIKSAFILILNIPSDVDVISLQKQLINDIPQILQVHDIHVWCLEGNSFIATIHVVFQGIRNEDHFTSISERIKAQFLKWDIQTVTFQPEFESSSFDNGKLENPTTLPSISPKADHHCLYKCLPECAKNTCCGLHPSRSLSRLEHSQLETRTQANNIKDSVENEVLENLIAQVV